MRFLAFLPLIILSFFTYSQNPDEVAIREVLAQQEECWNAGDLECFMEGYWKSDQLVFIGSQGVTYGWQQTLNNYKKSYPDKATMGQLTFNLIIVEPLSEDFWTVIGKWSLKRKSDNPHGHFSLIFRRLGNEWVIVSDHSS
ncbi:YybH family protein [Ekhidna sp.]|uniref:YybH family protein n=1 Tax=Ekhidna sp. TaxID=2608089 RepID=UPI003C7E9440